ncbi:MAG TPA: glycosyltransferase, partial [Dehalococcoidia bacterium]|nr:glycosyltransferase [Dehalococcoidia bacterium]
MTTVELVIPVYNEAHVLGQSLDTLVAFLGAQLPYRWRIVVADNASTDGTLAVAQQCAAADPRVRVLHLPEKGRGRALKTAWLGSDADILSYMDVDLS